MKMGKNRYLKRIIKVIESHGSMTITGIHEHLLTQVQPRLNSTYRNNPTVFEISNILSKNPMNFVIVGTDRHRGRPNNSREIPIWGLVGDENE